MKDIDLIYCTARELPSEERPAYLAQACRGDGAMRARMEQMLAVAASAEAFIEDPPDAVVAERKSGSGFAPTIKLEPADNPDAVLGEKIGRYKILERVGEGGCGAVYVAEQTEPVRRRVALKVIKLGMDTKEVIARFEAERQALAMMDHPNIAKVLDAGTTDMGRPYFVMELVRGIRITDYCDQANLTTNERLDLFIKVCQAIQHAHQKGIIHRDIKPSNILVTLHDGVPVPKVIDFGIAKATEGRLTDATVYTQLHQFMGTPAYMSPEQAEMSGLDIDTRSDIYSLGVLLYELLAGSPPFDAKELMASGIDQMRKTIREKEPMRPSTRFATLKGETLTTAAKRRSADTSKLMHQLKGDLDWIVMKCLEKDRGRRYETANGLAADLKRHLNNEPVVARPPSTAYRMQKALRRNKPAFAAAMAIAMVLLLGVLISAWQALRATRSEREQSHLREVAERATASQALDRQRAEHAQAGAEASAREARNEAVKSYRQQYAADTLASQHAIEAGNLGNAQRLLAKYFPHEGKEELRGFEWRYWWHVSQGQQSKTLRGHSNVVHTVAWSPDGKWLVSGSRDGMVKMWNIQTTEAVATIPAHRARVLSISFSPDARLMGTTGDDGRLHVWDVASRTIVFTITNESPRVSFSPKGRLLAVGTGGDVWGQRGSDVQLWDYTTRQPVRTLRKAGDRAAFSPDGKTLATANARKAVVLWDVESGRELRALENLPQALGFEFTPDGRTLAICTREGALMLWDLRSSKAAVLREPTKDFTFSLSISPDGGLLATARQTHEVELWDLREQRQVAKLLGHGHEVWTAAFSPDGTMLASGGKDRNILLWEPAPIGELPFIPDVAIQGNRSIGNPKFSPDSRFLAKGGKNGDVQLIDAATLRNHLQLTKAGLPIGFTPDGHSLWTIQQASNTLQRWSLTSGRLAASTQLITTNRNWISGALSFDQKVIVTTAGRRSNVEVIDTQTGRVLEQFQSNIDASSLALSPDGHLVALAGWRGRRGATEIWDRKEQRRLWTSDSNPDHVSTVAFSPNGKLLATGSWDGTARIWDPTTGKELAVLIGHKAGLLRCEFTPDSRTLATSSDDHTIKLWNADTFREVASFPSHTANYCLAFSPDGLMLAASETPESLRILRAPRAEESAPKETQAR